MRSGWIVWTAMSVVACAAPARQYTLKLDAADHSQSQLCYRDAQKDAGEESCEPFGAQDLHTPSTLTVKILDQDKNAKYDLRIAQFSREATPAQVQQVLQTSLERLSNLITLASGDTGTANKLINKAATAVKDNAPALANAAATKLAAPPPSTTARTPGDAIVIVDRDAWLKDRKDATNTNAPANLPFPRAVVLDADDLAALPAGVTLPQVAKSVTEWCAAASFPPPDLAATYKDFQTATPDSRALADKLSLTPADLARYITAQGASDPLGPTIEALIDRGEDWARGKAADDAAARAFYLMRLGKALQIELGRCEANIRTLGIVRSAAEQTAMAALTKASNGWSAEFDRVFGTLTRQTLVAAEQIIPFDGASTTITLEPGRVELGLGVTPSGGTRTEVATYKMKANGIERVAILVAPAFTLCTWGCFDQYDQVTLVKDDGPHSVVDKSERAYDISLVTAVHVNAYSWERWGLGGIIGYPIGTPSNTSQNVVVGAGLRHESGIELAIGVQAMLSQQLKTAYTPPFDLGAAGHENLTLDSVTRDRRELGVFFLVGFAPDILGALNK